MAAILSVGLGSFLGGIARYVLSGWIVQAFSMRFPLGTFVVNFLGCFLIGVVSGLAENQGTISPETKLFLVTGFLGGFTTFSAFGLETMTLLRAEAGLVAVVYVTLSVFVCIGAVWAGIRMTS